MVSDSQAALDRLIAAFEAHHAAAEATSDPDSDEVVLAEEALQDAFFTYDDALFVSYGVELPFDIESLDDYIEEFPEDTDGDGGDDTEFEEIDDFDMLDDDDDHSHDSDDDNGSDDGDDEDFDGLEDFDDSDDDDADGVDEDIFDRPSSHQGS